MPTLKQCIRSWAKSPDPRCECSADQLQITVHAAGKRWQLMVVPVGSGDKGDWMLVERNLPALWWALEEPGMDEVKSKLRGHLEALKQEESDMEV